MTVTLDFSIILQSLQRSSEQVFFSPGQSLPPLEGGGLSQDLTFAFLPTGIGLPVVAGLKVAGLGGRTHSGQGLGGPTTFLDTGLQEIHSVETLQALQPPSTAPSNEGY